MKKTVQIQDGLLKVARKVAAEEGTTVGALIEEGLRRVVEQRQLSNRFRLREASFGQGGLHPDIREGSWEQIRDLADEGRGEPR